MEDESTLVCKYQIGHLGGCHFLKITTIHNACDCDCVSLIILSPVSSSSAGTEEANYQTRLHSFNYHNSSSPPPLLTMCVLLVVLLPSLLLLIYVTKLHHYTSCVAAVTSSSPLTNSAPPSRISSHTFPFVSQSVGITRKLHSFALVAYLNRQSFTYPQIESQRVLKQNDK